MHDEERDGEPLPPTDARGCASVMFRTGCVMAMLQILMALAIIAAALISLIFFR